MCVSQTMVERVDGRAVHPTQKYEFDGSEPGPGNNRFTRLKYVGFWNAPNKTLFPARLTDNLETVIGADQKIGEN